MHNGLHTAAAPFQLTETCPLGHVVAGGGVVVLVTQRPALQVWPLGHVPQLPEPHELGPHAMPVQVHVGVEELMRHCPPPLQV